jgi:hypothetical protein
VSGASRVTSVDRVNQSDTNNEVIQLATENPHVSIQIAVQDPHPKIGDLISWGVHHVEWNGKALRKLGYEVDPMAPLG